MFSIAAINDVVPVQQDWQPLAPTKEAQEFRLTQMYNESLRLLQAGEYKQAQKILQAIIEDPLSESANTSNSDPMLHLRFLSYRNLAESFLKQGPQLHKEALQCFLHAVSIDGKDVTVWNRLGTLACSLGSYNIARCAFEQGLRCSPHHWACMEKLVEVLIAIGDELACLSIVKRLLTISPAHPRALLIKGVIEENTDSPEMTEGIAKPNKYSIMVRGIDKLKPYHHTLSFSKKRKLEELTATVEATTRKNLQLNLSEASFTELVSKVAEAIEGFSTQNLANMQSSGTLSLVNAAVSFSLKGKPIKEVELPANNAMDLEGMMVNADVSLEFHETEGTPCVKKLKQEVTTKLNASCEKVSTLKDTPGDEEPHLERRSTRLERIRTRNTDKTEDLESIQPDASKNKALVGEILKLLEPFVVCKESSDSDAPSLTFSRPEEDSFQALSLVEERELLNFLLENASNSGVYHVAQRLLEKMSSTIMKPFESWTSLLQLEKSIRCVSHNPSPFCSLFLAEVCMDMASSSTGELETAAFLQDCDYHLCRILGCVAATMSSLHVPANGAMVAKEQDTELLGCWSFWVRFHWVSGRLCYFQGNSERGREDFRKCLMILKGRKQDEIVNLPHCKVDKQISGDTIQYKLHEVQIQDLLSHSAAQMLECGRYFDLIELLEPILLRRARGQKRSFVAGKEHGADFATELSALDMLIIACEKCQPKNMDVALRCYNQRMHIHLHTAGIVNANGVTSILGQCIGHTQLGGNKCGDQFKVIAEEVKRISRLLAESDPKGPDRFSMLSPDPKVLGHMQQLLLTVMCNLSSIRSVQRSAGLSAAVSELSEPCETTCFVDAAVAFCRLQHLYLAASVKEQVELLVGVHEVLAERGLCCAGKGCEGGEGVFLKMAIRHFLFLEMKLKLASSAESNIEEISGDAKDETPKQLDVNSIDTADPVNRANETVVEDNIVEATKDGSLQKKRKTLHASDGSELVCDVEKRKTDLGLDIALDQTFFCLYGLNLRSGLESSGSQDGLNVHENTSLGDYQTREQCVEVFQYLLPYSRVCTKGGLIKLRKVLRAIRQHFPDPPEDELENSAVDVFLDDMDMDENKLSDMILNHFGTREVLAYALKNVGPSTIINGQGGDQSHGDDPVGDKDVTKATEGHSSHVSEDGDDTMKHGQHREVYENLFYLLTQVEETSASDKWPGFVFTEEGTEFVEQSAKLIKYDLMYNLERFDSWQRLANVYDEEVDLMLNDGSKTCSALEWRKNASFTKRVETGRRRTRRCLLMSMVLAKTPEQECSVHELLALVYYDAIQNVAPSFNQRQCIVIRDVAWREVCQKSVVHFEKALSFKYDWMYLFYLGKLCEKLHEPFDRALDYYQKAVESNPAAVDPFYRLHASRLKLLCTRGRGDLDIMKVIAKYCYNPETQNQVHDLLQKGQNDLNHNESQVTMCMLPESVWNILFEDGIKALQACVEGELKHYHKARYRIAQCLFVRNKSNDIERAKEELGFCFKSNRSPFIINMWEIDGSTKKNRRKMPGSMATRRGFEIKMPESSRKFITCLRKYVLFYLHLCEKTFDICTLEKAYCYLRVDKKFSLCLADMVHVALGKYIHTLQAAISQFDAVGMVPNLSLKNLFERFFNIFMEYGGSWMDTASVSLMEAGVVSSNGVLEHVLYSYIHRYVHSLECENQVDILESINEKIKKRFKSLKLVKEPCSGVCKHAAIAWCRSLCASLLEITQLQGHPDALTNSRVSQGQLVVELKMDELFINMADFCLPNEQVITMQQFGALSCMTGVHIRQVDDTMMDKASTLLRQTFMFYRDCTGPFPAGVYLYLIQQGFSSGEMLSTGMPHGSTSVVGLDLSVPRKLLLWAYTLVHGHTCSIADAVKYCEEQAKVKVRKGFPHASPPVNVQDKTSASVPREALGSSTVRMRNDDVDDAKDKAISEEHDSVTGSFLALPPCDTLPTVQQSIKDPSERDEKSRPHSVGSTEPQSVKPSGLT